MVQVAEPLTHIGIFAVAVMESASIAKEDMLSVEVDNMNHRNSVRV